MAPIAEKVIAVTGAASGIGYAIAHHIASLGARVAITDTSKDENGSRYQLVPVYCANHVAELPTNQIQCPLHVDLLSKGKAIDDDFPYGHLSRFFWVHSAVLTAPSKRPKVLTMSLIQASTAPRSRMFATQLKTLSLPAMISNSFFADFKPSMEISVIATRAPSEAIW
ncbi:unnamed protein product [Alternaria alternata]